MKLSARTKYGVKAMVELAERYGTGPVQLKLVAHHQDISVKYLEQLMVMLKSAGLVQSIRGAKGGYVLAKTPGQIKLSDCFDALEGPLITVQCVEDADSCRRIAECAVRDVWVNVQKAVAGVLGSTTLQDLVDKTREKANLDYQI